MVALSCKVFSLYLHRIRQVVFITVIRTEDLTFIVQSDEGENCGSIRFGTTDIQHIRRRFQLDNSESVLKIVKIFW